MGIADRHRRRRGPRGHRPRRDGPLAAPPPVVVSRDDRASATRPRRRRRSPRRAVPPSDDDRRRVETTSAGRRADEARRPSSRAARRSPSRVQPASRPSTSRSTPRSSASPGGSSSTGRSSPASRSALGGVRRRRARVPLAVGRRRLRRQGHGRQRQPTSRTSFDNKEPFYNAGGKTYIQPYPKDDAPEGEEGVRPTARRCSPGWRRASSRCTRSACTSAAACRGARRSQWFECPCHGSKYNRVGEKKGGPAPRGLDRFSLEVSGGNIIVDTGSRRAGSADRHRHHRPGPRGRAVRLTARRDRPRSSPRSGCRPHGFPHHPHRLQPAADRGFLGFIIYRVVSLRRNPEPKEPENLTPFFDDDELEGAHLERVLGVALIALVDRRSSALLGVLHLRALPRRRRRRGLQGPVDRARRDAVRQRRSPSTTTAPSRCCAPNCHGVDGGGGSATFVIQSEDPRCEADQRSTPSSPRSSRTACRSRSRGRRPTCRWHRCGTTASS